ncbi:MAG: hydrolase [Candidatus Eremiobacteraeota bacterium]|nr:hydrolase [Candidatus Eremiobacteraeota bacterium]MCW5868826.1 hydrolase [Candidatus Eremiobacteraeota bacterium]
MIIYVDVDDTLVRSFGSKQIAMSATQDYVRQLQQAGATLYCWSSGGADYARRVATEAGLAECFIAYLPKPHPNECRSTPGEELLQRCAT